MKNKTRYVQVGLGGRSRMFFNAVLKDYADTSELLAVCDINEGRLQLAVNEAQAMGKSIKAYAAHQFDQMIEECKPDAVIVTTKDCYHDKYVIRAMELGCDAITEKPMTTDADKCQAMIDAQHKTGKSLRVTFNYRYSPPRSQMKAILMSGVIGEVLSLDFHWMLDIRHGADYFRRWHRNKANSGGLMVHKATHHFDLINWWLSAIPEQVYAQGHRHFYTPATADRYGLKDRTERCLTCPETSCKFRLNMRAHDSMKALYLDNEVYDGYFRDRCVFSELIDIEDNMNVIVNYDNGVKMSYSLNAFMPWEGYMVTINGTKGRIEHRTVETSYINADGSVPGQTLKKETYIRIIPHFGPSYDVPLWTSKGGHGGGDSRILQDLFAENPPADPFLRAADQRSGAYSILTGVAANLSMERNTPIQIADLVSDIGYPDYPDMPSSDAPLSFEASEQINIPQKE